jgi:hypothetical protein
MLTRRLVLAAAGAALAAPAWAADAIAMKVYRTESCGCCLNWVKAMQKAGFTTEVAVVEDVAALWRKRKIDDELSSCHVAEVGPYVVLGHVPAADIRRLLAEKPDALGLTVPGMVMGSPGMETPSGRVTPYETLLLAKDGSRSAVWAKHS